MAALVRRWTSVTGAITGYQNTAVTMRVLGLQGSIVSRPGGTVRGTANSIDGADVRSFLIGEPL